VLSSMHESPTNSHLLAIAGMLGSWSNAKLVTWILSAYGELPIECLQALFNLLHRVSGSIAYE
jgi:hypothetical protein